MFVPDIPHLPVARS